MATSPTVWRRWLALDLRHKREALGMSQDQAAKRAGLSRPQLALIEGAQRSLTEPNLLTFLSLYGVPEERWTYYVQATKDARSPRWWQQYRLPDWFSLYVGLEQGASRIFSFQPIFVDGLLQTHDYAAALAAGEIEPRTENEVSRFAELRTQRQEVLVSGSLLFSLVVDESALRRFVGCRRVIQRQLSHLADVTELPNVEVRVIPFAAGAYPGATPFKILQFGFENDPGVVYVEYRTGAIYLETVREIEEHTLLHQHLCSLALEPEASTRIIRELAEEYVP